MKGFRHPPRDTPVVRHAQNEDLLAIEHSHTQLPLWKKTENLPFSAYKKANPVRGSLSC
jgi:hypothetical protein